MVIEKVFVDVLNVKDHFDVEKYANKSKHNRNQQMQSLQSRKKRSTKQKSYSKKNKQSGKLTFGLYKFIILAFVMIFFALSLQLISYFWIETLNNTAKNVLMAYLCAIDNWNAFFSMWSLALITVHYNNTVPAWDNSTTYDMYKYFENHTQYKVLNNFTNLLSADLHNYTHNYSVVFDTGDSC